MEFAGGRRHGKMPPNAGNGRSKTHHDCPRQIRLEGEVLRARPIRYCDDRAALDDAGIVGFRGNHKKQFVRERAGKRRKQVRTEQL